MKKDLIKKVYKLLNIKNNLYKNIKYILENARDFDNKESLEKYVENIIFNEIDKKFSEKELIKMIDFFNSDLGQKIILFKIDDFLMEPK